MLSNVKFLFLATTLALFFPKISDAYPVFAQNSYENPREETGRIVCANCHLASKPVEIEAPQAVLPQRVFQTIVTLPSRGTLQQLTANGKRGSLNVGAVLILPKGFELAPKFRIPYYIKAKTKGLFIQQYSRERPNILVVGPFAEVSSGTTGVSAVASREIVFPIVSPDPTKDKSVNFLNYPFYVGANCGRGQLYPNGEKSNNNLVTSIVAGKVMAIEPDEKGKVSITIDSATEGPVKQLIPYGVSIFVKVGDVVKVDQPLTLDPNVGGFGQNETKVVLQNPGRVKYMIGFFFTVTFTQLFLVFKKKQFEKVQLDLN